TTGLLALQWRSDLTPTTRPARTANSAVLLLLWAVAASGLALLIGRETSAIALLLALHLGVVIALFALLPYSKLVHAGYRIIALVIERIER
ncbi:MAG: signal transduction protein, partial [Chromatium okenii]|nr:signal transduction protein [Chromatium okenii]